MSLASTLTRSQIVITRFMLCSIRSTVVPASRIERIKLKPCAADKQGAIIRREALELAQYPFDLAREPPLKVTLLSFDKSSHALVVNVHHLVTDGWSQRLF